MKALTFHQPWASLVALGVKTIETRSWSTQYRGPLAIHAGKRRPVVDKYGPYAVIPAHAVAKDSDEGHLGSHCLWSDEGWFVLPQGAVVATCTLVDVVPIIVTTSGRVRETPYDRGHGDCVEVEGEHLIHWWHHDAGCRDVCDQRLYGDFSLGRWAWLLADIESVEPPVPTKGRQGLWRWTA